MHIDSFRQVSVFVRQIFVLLSPFSKWRLANRMISLVREQHEHYALPTGTNNSVFLVGGISPPALGMVLFVTWQ